MLATLGCQRAGDVQWVASDQVKQLDRKLQIVVQHELQQLCGSPSQPRLIGQDEKQLTSHLKHGAQIYQARCAGCHGATGDGNGPAATYLYPRPRDYRHGVFKFTSTPYGAKPLRNDLVTTVKRGALGTSMPSFKFLAPSEIDAVVDYVLVLTHRGELETLLALEAESDDAIDSANAAGYVQELQTHWSRANEQIVYPLSRETPYTQASIERGKQAFLSETAGCFKCHGNNGRGQADNVDGSQKVQRWGGRNV